jgi:uncharacterized protein DUF4136
MTIRGILIVSLSAFLCSCIAPEPPRVISTITTFHTLSDDLRGKTFAIIPLDKNKNTDLEFASYARTVGQYLVARGLQPVDVEHLQRPDFDVFMDYGIDQGRTEVSSIPTFGVTNPGGTTTTTGTVYSPGGPSSYTASSYTAPEFGVTGFVPVSNRIYKRNLVLEFLDGPQLEKKQIVKLYQAHVVSEGSNGAIAVVMPSMLDALFQDFPGKNGETRQVSIVLPPPPKTK